MTSRRKGLGGSGGTDKTATAGKHSDRTQMRSSSSQEVEIFLGFFRGAGSQDGERMGAHENRSVIQYGTQKQNGQSERTARQLCHSTLPLGYATHSTNLSIKRSEDVTEMTDT